MKNIAMSVRVSEEDAQFIAELEVPGAKTPSEKLRAIIAEAREQRQGAEDYVTSIAMVERMLSPARRQIRAAERESAKHSELVATVYDWLPEILGTAVATPVDGDSIDLDNREAALADQVFRLVDTVLRMGVTSRCRCYSPVVVSSRLEPILELVGMIEATRQLRNREENR